MPLRAVIYARLSPTPRGDAFAGGNLEQQIAMCRAKCEDNGWEVVRVVEDRDVSAVTRKVRPGWRELLGLVEAGEVEVVIGRHYDRLYRRPVDLEELIRLTEDTGIRIVAAEGDALGIDLTSATGLLQARVLVAFAAGEVDIKRERQLAGQLRRVEAGLPFWGNRPFGYATDLSICESEAEHIRNAYRAVLEGVSVASLVREWNARGLVTVKDYPWSRTTLRRLLCHPRNAAIVVYDGIEMNVEAAWEPLVSVDVYRAVALLLSFPFKGTISDPFVRHGLLSGIATCGVVLRDRSLCGGPLAQGANGPRADGTQLRKYVCATCHRASFPADLLENYVMAGLFHRTHSSSGGRGAIPESHDVETKTARAIVGQLRDRKEELRDLFVSGEITKVDYLGANRLVDKRLIAARTDLAIAQLRRDREDKTEVSRFRFTDLVEMYCDAARHPELRRIIRDHVAFLAITAGGKSHQRRLDEIIATWRVEDVLDSDPIPVDSEAWENAQIKMAAARAVWAEARMQRKADLITRKEQELAELRSRPDPRNPSSAARNAKPRPRPVSS